MKNPLQPRSFSRILLSASLIVSLSQLRAQEEKKDEDKEVLQLSPFEVSSTPSLGYSSTATLAGTRLGATVGGAKDVSYFREAVKQNQFPHPNTITPEGLFSEYDLPLTTQNPGSGLLNLTGEAMPVKLLTRPEVTTLAQIGFSSGLTAATWHRDPLNLIAVVDKSGSMSGQPIELVKRSLLQVLAQLNEHDQFGIVLYGDRAHVFLDPTPVTPANRATIAQTIEAIQIAGSTNMEAGLKVGFDLARRSKRDFKGQTRVLQFTDERPNVGDTSVEGFMGLMEAASRDGIGQTTIGVGEQFGAELASKVSSVRGGNLYFFADCSTMEKTFKEELDMLVTELAYDLRVKITPAPGMKIAGVYGVPGEMLEWEGPNAITFKVTTVFLSKRKGAIFVAFAPEGEFLPARKPGQNTSVGSVSLTYSEINDVKPRTCELTFPMIPAEKASEGLRRGQYLVNEVLSLKRALTAHLSENNQEKARALLQDLHAYLQQEPDAALDKERLLVGTLLERLNKLSGHGTEPLAESAVELDLGCFMPDAHEVTMTVDMTSQETKTRATQTLE